LTPRPPTSEINKYLRSNHPIEASAAAERTQGEPENRTEGKGAEETRAEKGREGKRRDQGKAGKGEID
jgi:hypothetical protein